MAGEQRPLTSNLPCAPSSTSVSRAGLRETGTSPPRDAPYFGFEIPDAPGKYFYGLVRRRPLAHIAALGRHFRQRGLEFDPTGSGGADNHTNCTIFISVKESILHTLFWPRCCRPRLPPPHPACTFRLPAVEGQKNSRGPTCAARSHCVAGATWSCFLPITCGTTSPQSSAMAWTTAISNLDDFTARVNSDWWASW